jgi:uncharacterized protein (TIGR02594 family)
MPAFDHDAFMTEWRASRNENGLKISSEEYALIMALSKGTWTPKVVATNRTNEPAWLAVARDLMGQREIVGPKHNSWISKGWAKLGASWFNDDETPWCGFFVAHCMDVVGLSYPAKGMFARAKSWLNWGKACSPVLGAVVVFSRKGGGHVGFLVGESSTHYYVLGGNQDNCVNISPFNKTTRPPEGFRWPVSLPLETTKLPKMSGGVVTRSEA